MARLKRLETVATLKPIPTQRLNLVEPEHKSIQNLPAGQVGTIVEVYDTQEPRRYLIEFADLQGREYAMAILAEDEVLALHYELTIA
jgi:hypothetical protein